MRVHALVDSLSAGGAELLVAEFARVAPDVGVHLSVAHLYGREDEGPAARHLREVGIEPYAVPIGDRLSPLAFARVRRHLATIDFELLHTHLGNADLLGGVVAASLRKPTVSTIHGMDWSGDARARAKYSLMAWARRRFAARVIAVSESARAAYLDRGWDRPEHLVVVRNGLAREAAHGAGGAVRAQLGLDPRNFVAAIISTFRPEKGHETGIAAAAALRERLPAFRLLIVGYGLPERERRLRELAAPLGNVVFAGHRGDVMAVLDAVDVLIQPSVADAYPTTIMEAMAAGVPVVASSVGGIPEMVEDGTSALLLGAAPTASGLAAAITRLAEDEALRAALAEAGRRHFDAHHSASRWAAEMRAVYDEVLATRSRRSRG